MKLYIKLAIMFYVLFLIARIAGEVHKPILLYCGIMLGFYWIVYRFPVYKIQENNDQNIEE
jgi:hypothetical protein